MKTVLRFGAFACVGVCIFFMLDPGTSAKPAGPVPLSSVETEPVGGASSQVEEIIKRALDRLPAHAAVTGGGQAPTPSESDATFAPTEGCTSEALLLSLISSPREHYLRCLWDSSDFNPRRVHVSQASREQCLKALDPYIKAASDCRRAASDAGMKEFGQHVAARSPGLPFISIERYVAILKARSPHLVDPSASIDKLPFIPSVAFDFEANLFRFAGDGWFGSRTVDMPTARPAYQAMAFTGLELARAAIEFGLAFGTITSDEADRLRDAALVKFDSMTR
jgi:hypothetical protein